MTENISQKSMLVPRYAQHSTRRNVLNIISHNDWFSSITEKVYYSEKATLFLFLMVEFNHDPSFTKRPLAKPLAKIVSDDQNHNWWSTTQSHYRLTDNKSIARNNIQLNQVLCSNSSKITRMKGPLGHSDEKMRRWLILEEIPHYPDIIFNRLPSLRFCQPRKGWK